jgi:hypothetical protein
MPAIVKRADLILLATEKRDLMLPTPEGTEWICAEEPLKEQIQQTLYDPHRRFINATARCRVGRARRRDEPVLAEAVHRASALRHAEAVGG